MDRESNDYVNTTFEASADNVTWDALFTVTGTIHHAYNIWRPDSTPNKNTKIYRYVRARHTGYNNTPTANCQWSELSIFGYRYFKQEVQETISTDAQGNNVTLTSLVCPVEATIAG